MTRTARKTSQIAGSVDKTGAVLSASIEISPKQALESNDLPRLFPADTRVYIVDIGTAETEVLVAAAKRVRDLGYRPVPHFASRRLTTKFALEERIKAMTQSAGVQDILVIGGGLDRPKGQFTSSIQVLETGLLDKYGITHAGIAGHPEGSPDFSETAAMEALELKKAFAERTGAKMRIVTQFGFDAEKFTNWADGLAENGIALPIHLGVAGPAKLTTLIKYAASCGVGNSISFLKKQALSVATLASGFAPDQIVDPIETFVGANPASTIHKIHVFPFGGIKASANWLYQRGSWDEEERRNLLTQGN